MIQLLFQFQRELTLQTFNHLIKFYDFTNNEFEASIIKNLLRSKKVDWANVLKIKIKERTLHSVKIEVKILRTTQHEKEHRIKLISKIAQGGHSEVYRAYLFASK